MQVLDRAMTLPMSFDPSAAEMHREIPVRRSQVCVRDVSWHPQVGPMINLYINICANVRPGTCSDECSLGERARATEYGSSARMEGPKKRWSARGLGGKGGGGVG